MSDHNGLTIESSPSGRNGQATLTARLNGEPIAVEAFNLTKGKDRAAFVAKLCDGRPGIDKDAVEAELLRLAAELASKTDGQPAALDTMPELDVSAIIRPERFIAPDVSGLAVPTMTAIGESPTGRWLLYLRWADGKRECRPMPHCLDLPEGRRLWIHPNPSEPTPHTPRGWSAGARKRWLGGEPAPDPAEVFKAVAERFAYYLDFSTDQGPGVVATLTLWVLLTYCFHAWDAVPYLYIGGPMGSGKSRLFDVLARLAFRPLGSSNMSAAALFRTLHSQGGTLLLDEAERLKQTQDPGTAEILSMLLAGYKRGGQATRLEPVGDTFKTVSFDVYGPKALACVAGLPPALASRCIPIIMFRAAPGSDKPRRRIDGDPAGWQRLRNDLHALALEHGPTWLELPARADVCPAMSGRDYELWQPLLALAAWVESHGADGLLGLVQEHALATIDAGKDDQVGDADEILLRLLAERRANLDTPTPGEILKAAQEAEPTVFRQWSAKGAANALKRYGVRTVEVHGRKVYSRVTLADLRRIQATYGVALGLPEQPDGQEGP
jgi:hypothetical protein